MSLRSIDMHEELSGNLFESIDNGNVQSVSLAQVSRNICMHGEKGVCLFTRYLIDILAYLVGLSVGPVFRKQFGGQEWVMQVCSPE